MICYVLCSPISSPLVQLLILSTLTGNRVGLSLLFFLSAVKNTVPSLTLLDENKANIVTNLKKMLQVRNVICNVPSDLTFCPSPDIHRHTCSS